MRLLNWLFNSLFDTESGTRIKHAVLGEAVYMKAKSGSYWEVETEVQGKPFSLSIDAENSEEPTQAQVAFFERYAADPDLAFSKAAPLLVPEFERWTKHPFSGYWRTELSFVGMSVPLNANEQSEYELAFEAPRAAGTPHFACKVEHGAVTYVEVST